MSTKAILVIGAESTGTRLTTKLLIESGIYGTCEHVQEFQSFMYDEGKFAEWVKRKKLKNLVVRQSMPHGKLNFPSTKRWCERLAELFDDVTVIVTTRSWVPMIPSQINCAHVRTEDEALNNIKRAYKNIYNGIISTDVNWFNIHLSDMSNHPTETISFMMDQLNLPFDKSLITFIRCDVDSKRYNEYRQIKDM